MQRCESPGSSVLRLLLVVSTGIRTGSSVLTAVVGVPGCVHLGERMSRGGRMSKCGRMSKGGQMSKASCATPCAV